MYKVLVVEDEERIRKGLVYLVDWMALRCIVVGEAANGREGAALIRSLQPDIVVTDVRMPFASGIEMLEQSRGSWDGEVIIMSGYDEFEYAKKAISLGVAEYFLKPLDPDELAQAVRKIAGRLEVKRTLKKLEGLQRPNTDMLPLDGMSIRPPKNRHVAAMIEHVQAHYADKLSITDLSESLGASVSYLNAKFKEETGYTFNDFVNRYRIRKSLSLLGNTNMKVYEVAEAVGFQDYKYFIQVFKKYIGTSPMKFLNAQS